MANLKKINDPAGPDNDGSGTVVPVMDGVMSRGDNFRNVLSTYSQRARDLAGQIGGPVTVTDGGAEFTKNLLDNQARIANLNNTLMTDQRAFDRSLQGVQSAMADEERGLSRDIANKDLEMQNSVDPLDFTKQAISTAMGIGKLARTISGTDKFDSEKYEKKLNELKADRERALKGDYTDEDGVSSSGNHSHPIPDLTQEEEDLFKEQARKFATSSQDPGGVKGLANIVATKVERVFPGLREIKRNNEKNARLQGMVAKGIMTDSERKTYAKRIDEHFSRMEAVYASKPEISKEDRELFYTFLEDALTSLSNSGMDSNAISRLRRISDLLN